jgi:hypothetical protein
MKVSKLMAALAAFLLVAIAFANSAEAKNHHRHHYYIEQGGGDAHLSTEGSGRPAGCPRLWCGCWARLDAGLSDLRLNYALNWPRLLRRVAGRGAAPVIGSYAVMYRRGGGHVGRVTGVDASGNPIIKSGNHNHHVGEGAYPRSRIIAYVMP